MSGVLTLTASMVAEVEGGLKLWTENGIVVVMMPKDSRRPVTAAPPPEFPVKVIRAPGAPKRLQGGRRAEVRKAVAAAIDLWAGDVSLGIAEACRLCGVNKEAWDYHTRKGGSLREARMRAELARKVALEDAGL